MGCFPFVGLGIIISTWHTSAQRLQPTHRLSSNFSGLALQGITEAVISFSMVPPVCAHLHANECKGCLTLPLLPYQRLFI